MKIKKEDKRIRLTLAKIDKSLMQILKEKDISKMTVSEISKIAKINRGTFYLHYDNVEDAVDTFEKNFYSALEKEIAGIASKDLTTEAYINDLLNILKEHQDKCFILFCNCNNFTTLEKLLGNMKKQIYIKLKASNSVFKEEYFEYVFTYTSSGVVSIIKQWANNDMQESTKYMAHILFALITSCLLKLGDNK